MEYIKTYESFMGSVARLNPQRDKNDDKAVNLFKEIIDDFEKHGKDLKKVSINDDNDNLISWGEIKSSNYYRLSYIFGKYNPGKNNIFIGNTQAGNRKITITDVPFSFTLKKNSLEKAFNTDRLSLRRTTIKDVKTIDNPNYNPISKRKGERHLHDEIEDEYRISYDISNQLFKYFISEYNKQYPELKNSKYKSSMSISDIERGISPTLKYIHVTNKDGEELTLDITKDDNEKELRKKLYNMSKEEYDLFCKKRRDKRYKKSEEEDKKNKEKWEIKINSYLKKHGIDLSEYVDKWEKFGFSLIINSSEIRIEFRTTDKNIEDKINKVVKEDFGEYKLDATRVRKGYSYDKDGLFFVGIFFEIE